MDTYVRWTLSEADFDKRLGKSYWLEYMRPYLGKVGKQSKIGLVDFGLNDKMFFIPEKDLTVVKQ